jgi:hypothetical protein
LALNRLAHFRTFEHAIDDILWLFLPGRGHVCLQLEDFCKAKPESLHSLEFAFFVLAVFKMAVEKA